MIFKLGSNLLLSNFVIFLPSQQKNSELLRPYQGGGGSGLSSKNYKEFLMVGFSNNILLHALYGLLFSNVWRNILTRASSLQSFNCAVTHFRQENQILQHFTTVGHGIVQYSWGCSTNTFVIHSSIH